MIHFDIVGMNDYWEASEEGDNAYLTPYAPQTLDARSVNSHPAAGPGVLPLH